MIQEDNQKKAKSSFAPPNGATADKEEKDFLAREEVTTMKKDISSLRENEAHQEMQRVGQIKTKEELIKEREREALAKKASVERDLAEKEAKKREENIKKITEKKTIEQNTLSQIKTEESETASEKFQDTLKKTQTQEEEARKKFLAKIEARAEGKEEIPIIPPAPPIIKEEKIPEISKTLSKKQGFGQKLWIRIVLSLLLVSIIAVASTFLYWNFFIKDAQPPTETPPITIPVQKELIIVPSHFYTEDSQILQISQASDVPFLISQVLKNETTIGSVNRVLLEDTKNVEILKLEEFFDSFNITPPENFYNKLSNDTTLFIYSQEEGNRLGVVVKINDQDELEDMMTSWEETMEEDFQDLFVLLGKDEPALVSYFRDAEYQGINFRFQTFSRQDIGIVYAIFDDYFVLTTSWKSIEKALERLEEMPFSRFFNPPNNNIDAEFVLANMGLKEKIGQLFFIGINGTTLSEETEKLIIDIQPGGILLLKKNIVNKDQTKKLIQDLQQISLENYGIPLFIGVDQEGGEISPVDFIQEKTAQSEIKTADQAYAVGFGRGEELRAVGINLNLAPVLDTAQPGDFVFGRAFQTTALESYDFVKALISGQKTASILTAIKHFPGYGDITFDPEDKLATIDEMPQTNLFKTAIESEPEFIMTSNVIYSEIDPDLPFSFSPKGIELMKQSVGQGPLVMTDDLPQQSLIDKFSLKGVVTLPIIAGADILTFSTNWETTIQEAVNILNETVQNKEISQEQIDNSVLKIIKLKKTYYRYE